ncbi:hypothetical protein C3941_18705 [Kaistia algarum]|uniref:hypothetical protein n=1 Tax=Kaistia algarum TaxID=2083279 RepID=UPI000CE92AA1|nr:hypothetical protein [Kaistia algarum]MCX5516525.1 hypothetical protein [Kaistia algarum]PPE78361.1 hypothetical protein C3941_18705 [Kaistia algarum]
MIPASYLFRDLYRQRFEKDPAELLAEIESRKGRPIRGPLDGMIIAMIGAVFGSPTYVVGASTPECSDRRR